MVLNYIMFKFYPLRRIKGIENNLLKVVKKKKENLILDKNVIYPESHNKVERPWFNNAYFHDSMMMIKGERFIDIYNNKTNQIDKIFMSPFEIYINNQLLYNELCVLVLNPGSYFRIVSGSKKNESLNLHYSYKFKGLNTYNVIDIDSNNKMHLLRKENIWKQDKTI